MISSEFSEAYTDNLYDLVVELGSFARSFVRANLKQAALTTDKKPVFVIGELGVLGLKAPADILKFRAQQHALLSKQPLLKPYVRVVHTAPMWDVEAHDIFQKEGDSANFRKFGSERPFHYMGSGRCMLKMGSAFAEAMVELMEQNPGITGRCVFRHNAPL